ncbi:hypothetical protein NDA14_007011 [Ustilago hordei]|nr:hypothetical protein NDA10_003987 [Ustilago hordei]KAJ1598373.1 hypothetical protein NDA14_007011 [Ustilago hordei]
MLPFLAVCRSGFADAIAELEGNKPFLMMIASSKSGNAPLWVSCRMCRARLNSVGTDVAVSLVIVCLLVAMRKGNAKGQCERATGVLDVTATNQALTAKLPIKSIACGWKAISKKPTRLRERQG